MNKKKTASAISNEYILNFSRIKKIRDKFLIVTEQGAWILVGKKEREQLLRHELPKELFQKFENIGIILTTWNIHKVLGQEHKRRHFTFHAPSLHILLPTIRCNHRCIYCHSSAKACAGDEFDMSEETARKTVDFIINSASKKFKIEFQGGEALFNFELVKIVTDYAKEKVKGTGKKVGFSIVTNLTVIEQKQLDWLIENKIHITTSLDGPKHVHDKNRKYFDERGTYDDVIKKIKFCMNKGVRPGVLMVTTKHSLQYPEDIVDEYLNLGISFIQLKFLNKIGYAIDEWKKIGYNADEYLAFWKKAMEHILKINKNGTVFIDRFAQIILLKILKGYDPGFLDFRTPCGAVIGQVAYNYNGDIYSCDEGRGFDIFNLGNVKNTNYKTILKQKTTQDLISSSMLENTYCDLCIYKPYCNICPVLNYAETGTPIPKISSNYRCKIIKGMLDWIFEKILFEPEDREVLLSWVNK